MFIMFDRKQPGLKSWKVFNSTEQKTGSFDRASKNKKVLRPSRLPEILLLRNHRAGNRLNSASPSARNHSARALGSYLQSSTAEPFVSLRCHHIHQCGGWYVVTKSWRAGSHAHYAPGPHRIRPPQPVGPWWQNVPPHPRSPQTSSPVAVAPWGSSWRMGAPASSTPPWRDTVADCTQSLDIVDQHGWSAWWPGIRSSCRPPKGVCGCQGLEELHHVASTQKTVFLAIRKLISNKTSAWWEFIQVRHKLQRPWPARKISPEAYLFPAPHSGDPPNNVCPLARCQLCMCPNRHWPKPLKAAGWFA